MRLALLLALPLLASCAPSTNNELMDMVMTRVDPFGDCVVVVGQTVIRAPVEFGPPGQVVPNSFNDPALRQAARLLVARDDDVDWDAPTRLVGTGPEENCATHIGRPLISGDYAFVDYLESGGSKGIYAFERSWRGWVVAEHLHLGYW